MSIALFLTLFHIIGVALGVGGATVSDVLFFRALRDRRVSKDEFALLHTLGYILWTGLAILFVSGLGFVASQLITTGASSYLVSDWFWAKMTIIVVLFCNALVMHTKVFPFMKAHIGTRLNYSVVKPHVILLATTGVISITSWYSAMVLGVTRGLDFSYFYIINIYLLLVMSGILVAYALFLVVIFPQQSSTTHSARRTTTSLSLGRKVIWVMATTLLGVGIVSAAWFIADRAELTGGRVSSGQTHIVCIIESPPWFDDAVLEIEPGDTVMWTHCAEPENGHASADRVTPSVLLPTAYAHDGGDHAQQMVHTHPIVSLSGPEAFSSEFRPIGHAAEGDGFSFTFTKVGVYEYICPTHPYMKGIIAVGEPSPVESLWPPEENIDSSVGLPEVAGVGEVWVNTQFADISGQTYPGSVTVVDAATWEIDTVITDSTFNNPHNLWRASDGEFVYQTQWHSDLLSVIDVQTKQVERTVQLGNAPAHVFTHPHKDLVYVTINNENRIAVLDIEGTHLRDIITPFGPHGVWISPDGRYMSVASTLAEEFTIIDLETETIVAVLEAEGLPLAAAITHDGRYAMVSLLLEGKVRFVDLETMEVVQDVTVGTMPIWPSPGPEGSYVYVPNSGSATVSVIDLETLSVVRTIPVAAGAHGIAFGPKEGGGYYGYVTHKFARVLGVIDTDTQQLAGYVPLGEDGWGGNGVLPINNSYDEFIPNEVTIE